MNRYRYDKMRSYAASHSLQIVKARKYSDDDKITDFALVGFETFSDLSNACETLDLVPMAIQIIKDSRLHNIVKTYSAEEILRNINNDARRGQLDSSSSSYHARDEMRHPFVVNREDRFHTKLTTDKNKSLSLEDWLHGFWENVIYIMNDTNIDFAEKRTKILTLSKVLNTYNRECVSDESWSTSNMRGFQECVVEGMQIAVEKEENDVFVKYMDSLSKIVADYINMNDKSMLVICDYWLSKCNYKVVPIQFSMVNKYSDDMIFILGAVALGEYTIL